MNRALAAGAAGMAVQQAVLDAIAANLANADTPGYRADRPEFAALVAGDGRALAPEASVRRRLFSQGRLEATGNEYDFAISGAGFFEVAAADGRNAYTRAGNFAPDGSGKLALPNGTTLAGIRLPKGTTSVSVSPSGVVSAGVAGKAGTRIIGHVRLCSFANAAALSLHADGLFYPSADAGKPLAGIPGTAGFGLIKQRFLERSNVSIVAAMMAVLTAQRTYEANAKTVQAADEMLRLANNLERG